MAERLYTSEGISLYLDVCIEESGDDAAFIAKALGDIARAGYDQSGGRRGIELREFVQIAF